MAPVLAEVSDKMMSWPALTFWSAGLTVLAGFLIRKKKWLVVVPLLIALLLAIGSFEESRDPFVGPAVVHELGYHYVFLNYLPLIAIVVLITRIKKEPNQTLEPTAPSGRGSS